jgi:phage tail-like protein
MPTARLPRLPHAAGEKLSLLHNQESEYLCYLPGIYQQDDFMRRFLLIFESILRPLERAVDNLPCYTEPEMAPEEFLPWLAHWVAVALDRSWPIARQRMLIARAVEIFRWRGTLHGLGLHIEVYTGIEPLIQEYRDGFVLGRHNGLGWTTWLTSNPGNPYVFIVTVPVSNPRHIDEKVLHAIIEEDKPAHTIYRLHVVEASTNTSSRQTRRKHVR